MLGSLHTSDVRRFIPRLLHIGEITLKKRQQPLFKLDWDSVDAYKHQEYIDHRVRFEKRELPKESRFFIKGEAPRNWPGTYHEETVDGPDYAYNDQVVVHNTSPPTLPAKYDDKVKELTFTLPHDYRIEVEHFTRLFLSEHTRNRGFDTCVRDRCHSTAVSAIGNAFYLLSDCLYNQETEGWYRGPFKRVYQYLIAYKFWSGFTGRGMCWEHSGLDKLQATLAMILDDKKCLPFCPDPSRDAEVYSEVIAVMKQYEEELEEFYKYTAIKVPAVKSPIDEGLEACAEIEKAFADVNEPQT